MVCTVWVLVRFWQIEGVKALLEAQAGISQDGGQRGALGGSPGSLRFRFLWRPAPLLLLDHPTQEVLRQPLGGGLQGGVVPLLVLRVDRRGQDVVILWIWNQGEQRTLPVRM